MTRLKELAQRREGLIAQAAAQRERLARRYRQMMRPVWFVEGGVGLMDFFRAHPVITASMLPLLLKPMKFVTRRSLGLLKFFLFRPTIIAGLLALLFSTSGGKAALLKGVSVLRQLRVWLGGGQKQPS